MFRLWADMSLSTKLLAEVFPAGRESPQVSFHQSWQGLAHTMGSRQLPLTLAASGEDAGLAPQCAGVLGSHAAVLPLVVVQPYWHTVNASFQLPGHIANTQNSSASPQNELSGLYRKEILWEDTGTAHARAARVFSQALFAALSCCTGHDTCVSMVNSQRWVRQCKEMHMLDGSTESPSLQHVLTQGTTAQQQREQTWTALLCAYQTPDPQKSTVLLKMKLHLKE